MIYFFHGTDVNKIKEKIVSIREALIKKQPDINVFVLNEEDWTEGKIEELTLSQGLFEKKHIVVSRNVLDNTEIFDTVKSHAKALAESPNVFIFEEEDPTEKIKKVFEKHAEKVEGHDSKEVKKPERFNVFALTDAFASRDKKKSWIILTKAFDAGLEPEEIHGVLFWQVKSLILATSASSATEAGLAPFVFGKAKRYGANFKHDELQNISSNLLSMYHDAHRGKHDFKIALERFVLSI